VLFESLSQAGVAGQRTVSQSVNFMAGWSCLLMVQPDRGYGKERGQRGRERQSPSSQVYFKLVGSVLRLLRFNFSACLDYEWSPGLMCLTYQSEIC